MRGDSYRRQTELAEDYARKHELVLDRQLSMSDEGVSAFRAKNVRQGALGRFLRAVDDGIVQKGAYLLVENLDRVSRANPWDAMPVFQQIINAGVIIVTLQDGKRWSQEELRENPFRILESLMGMIRANEESEVKSRRLKAAWERKRANIVEVPLTARVPAWISLNKDSKVFEVIEDRAEVVRRIFAWANGGVGQNKIAETLNRLRVPCFGTAAMWHRSYIKKILENPAVIGISIPHTVEHVEHRRIRKPQAAMKGYFPSVVDEETFAAVRTQHSSIRAPVVRSGSKSQSLFASLARCSLCGGSMTRVTKGPRGGKAYLVCAKAKVGAGCFYNAVHQDELEAAFLGYAPGLPHEVLPEFEDDVLDITIEAAEMHYHEKLCELDNILDTIAQSPSPVLAERLRKLENEADTLRAEKSHLEMTRAARGGLATSRALAELHSAVGATPLDGAKINALLRQLFSRAVIDKDRIELFWRQPQGRSYIIPLFRFLRNDLRSPGRSALKGKSKP
jgi:DNA invertase Pin-like site-specific DNA recombinase